MNRDEKEKAERSAGVQESLQRYADTLSRVILAGRMCHAVTVAISTRNLDAQEDEDDAVLMASNTSTQGGNRREQVTYTKIHLAQLEHNARQALVDIETAVKQAEERSKGKVN